MLSFRLGLGSIALGLLVSVSASAEVFRTRIHEVMEPASANDVVRVLVEHDGRVLRLAPTEAEFAQKAREAAALGTEVTIRLAGNAVVALDAKEPELSSREPAPSSLTLEELEQFSASVGNSYLSSDPINEGYSPTVVSSMSEPSSLFAGLERLSGRTQCYQRAMLWTESMWNQRRVRSKKVFLFFTRRFIRQTNFDWWFHVAPFVETAEGERVLDPNFTKGPLPMQQWTDFFVRTKPVCPVITHYDQYERNQESEDCYLRKVPMYYYQPVDIEKFDRQGVRVDYFRHQDITHAERARHRLWPF